ncbi:eukaryotic cytochrome b561-domain-containing protein [Cladochytrium replicatum]|nr:eukaryotic cytochrome b561-domain-containing protein [Cladochytrium replicatum]
MSEEAAPLLPAPTERVTVDSTVVRRKSAAELWTSAILVKAGLAVFAFLVISAAINPLALFSAHPVSMSISIILTSSSILTLQQATASSRKNRSLFHSVLQLLNLVAALSGFTAIYRNKIRNGSDHFTTLHGRFGLATIIFIGTISLAGVIVQFFPSVFGWTVSSSPVSAIDRVRRRKALATVHRFFGYLLFLLLIITASLASASHWAEVTIPENGLYLIRVSLGLVLGNIAYGIDYTSIYNAIKLSLGGNNRVSVLFQPEN